MAASGMSVEAECAKPTKAATDAIIKAPSR